MSLCRLIYRSTTTDEIVSNEDLARLQAQAMRNNGPHGISGLLVLSGQTFLQVLEGPRREVNVLFQRISRDPMHHSVELISFEAEAEPQFEDWDMRLIDLYNLPLEQREALKQRYRHDDGELNISDDPAEAIALLLDAKEVCKREPWKN